jgi:hypothetical protein
MGHMKPQLPGLPTVVALMLTAMIAAWIGILGPLDLSRLQAWQTSIVGISALCGVLFTATVAVRNVSRQIRINILSREEDRIERMLPGLREADTFASGFLQYRITQGFVGIVDAFRTDGFGVQGSTYQKDVMKALPYTDGATRRRVEQLLYVCFRWAIHAESGRQSVETKSAHTRDHAQWVPSELKKALADLDEARKFYSQARDQFRLSMDGLEAGIIAIRKSVNLYETRLLRIRREIEVYFDESM